MGETSTEGGLLASAKPLPLWLDGIMLESWKAEENSPGNKLGVCEVFTRHYLIQILLGCFGLKRVNFEQKRKEIQPA